MKLTAVALLLLLPAVPAFAAISGNGTIVGGTTYVPIGNTSTSLNVNETGTPSVSYGSGTFPVSATSLPLPSGAATSAAQATMQTTLNSLDTKTPTLGQKIMSGSSPVVLSSDQSTLTVQGQGAAGSPSGGVFSVQGVAMNSTVNSTTAQLAVGATFTGTIENVFNQQTVSIQVVSDQNGTLTVNQYIDADGSRKSASISYTIISGMPFNRAIHVVGAYFNLAFKNTGMATTTTLSINTAYGALGMATALGNMQVSLDEINGIASSARPDGFLRVATDPTTMVYDTFEIYDTANVWTAAGTVPPTGGAGNLDVLPGTAANATSYTKTQPVFIQSVNAYLQYLGIIQINAATITGNQRFWGIGTFTSPTLSAPVSDGAVFEIDNVTGNLFASIYSGSVRTQTATLVRPTDGNFHRYSLFYKASKVYFELDNVVVTSFPFPNPTIGTQALVFGSINGAGVLGTAPTLAVSATGLGDTARSAVKISDGKYPWRQATVTAAGVAPSATDPAMVVSMSPNSPALAIATYAAAFNSFLASAPATDSCTITGSATKLVKVKQVRVTGIETSVGNQVVLLIKRSSADSGGTSTTGVAVPLDSNDAAASAVAKSYTLAPITLGTAVGTIVADRLLFSPTTGGSANSQTGVYEFNGVDRKPIFLRGTAETLAVNLNGSTIVGGTVSCTFTWTEE